MANPPYSVKGFKSTVVDGNKNFELFKYISDESGEIEILFIERMTQLIEAGGYVGIILPQSLLSNVKKYEQSRAQILSHFRLKGVVFLGSGAFMKTGTNTVILFLQKREKNIPHLKSKDDYERLSASENVVVVTTGGNIKEQRRMLGYEFSERKGKEGLATGDTGILVNETDPLDQSKVSYYIRNALLGNPITAVAPEVTENVRIVPLSGCFDFTTEDDEFSNTLSFWGEEASRNSTAPDEEASTGKTPPTALDPADQGKYPMVTIKSLIDDGILEAKRGQSITAKDAISGSIPVIASGVSHAYTHNKSNFDGDVVTVSSSGSAGMVRYHASAIWASDCSVLRSRDTDILLTKYLYYALLAISDSVQRKAHGSVQMHVYIRDLHDLRIPLPGTSIQKQIVIKRDEQQKLIEMKHNEIRELQANVGKPVDSDS